MQINVETKPVASIAYNSKKKRLVETIDVSITATPKHLCQENDFAGAPGRHGFDSR